MVKYENGKIYVIRSPQTDEIYIGSTTQQLSTRFSKHKHDYKRHLNGNYTFVSSFNLIKLGDAYIELLEIYSCDTKIELEKREGELMRSMNCSNKRIPSGLTREEYNKKYYGDNREKIMEQNKKYYQDNKETIKKYVSDKLECIECGKTIRRDCMHNHKKIKHSIIPSIPESQSA